MSGPDFDQAYARSQAYQVEKTTLRMVAREDFIAPKKAFGRSIDLRDIEAL
jgi:hypothetical protein